MRTLRLLLTGSAVFLALYFLADATRSHTIVPSEKRRRTEDRSDPAARDPLKAVQGFSLELFKTKPLFPGNAEAVAAQPPHTFILLGVSTGDKTLASLKDTVTGKIYYFSQGDDVEGFRVTSITDNKVSLDNGRETVEITR